jgi:hypothetical protein
MGSMESVLEADALARARALLEPPPRKDPTWPALLAATALALTSVIFATIMVLAPPAQTEHVVQSAPQ